MVATAFAFTLVTTGVGAAIETPPESPVIECGDHMQAILAARSALVSGNRVEAIRNLRRAQDALRACSIRSEAEEIAFG